MQIILQNIKPAYMSEQEVKNSDIYLKEKLIFEKKSKYLIKADSGKGKSSLLNFIYGSNSNFEGKIYYGEKYNDFIDFRNHKISYVFQDLKLFPLLSVFDNIELKNKLTRHKTTEEIDLWIKQVGLAGKRNELVKNLSLGQRQRVAILRSLCQAFDFILLDEPFSHLDENNINILTGIIKQEVNNNEAGLIMTSLVEKNYFNFDKIFYL